jgi:hypothetical protein
MSFTQSTFAPVGPQSTNAPSIYSYSTNDTIAEVTTSGYFVDKIGQLEEGDYIIAVTAIGTYTVGVDSDTSTVSLIDSGGVFNAILNSTILENDNSLITNGLQMIKLLTAILEGIEKITGQENLIDNVEE